MKKPRKPLPTLERVRRLFFYDPDTGIVIRRVCINGEPAGAVVGTANRDYNTHYFFVSVDGTSIRLHRLIFFYVTGRWPVLVDHVNRHGLDNRWINLREATPSLNRANVLGFSKCGFKGVSFVKRTGNFVSRIRKDGKFHYLGVYRTALTAHLAYVAKAKELFGEFARFE